MSAAAGAAMQSPALGVRVCGVDDVPLGEGRAVTVEGRRIAIFNAPSGWYAIDAACPHRGGPLADGIVADCCVTCPLHDRRYDLATGAAVGDHPGVAAHAAEVRDGEVVVTLANEREEGEWSRSDES